MYAPEATQEMKPAHPSCDSQIVKLQILIEVRLDERSDCAQPLLLARGWRGRM